MPEATPKQLVDYELISPLEYCDAPTTSHPIPNTLPTADGDRIVAAMTHMGDMLIHCSAPLEGRIDAPRLARAVRLAVDAEPVLGCFMKWHWRKPHWIRHPHLDQLPLCTFEETEDTEQSLQNFLKIPLDFTKDPLVRVHIMRHGPDDTLCFKVNHIIADAGGTKDFLYLVASLYRRLGSQPDLQVTPNLQGERNITQLTRLFTWGTTWKIIRRAFGDMFARLWPLRRIELGSQPGPATQRAYKFRHISPTHGQVLKHFGREHNATINDLLVSALARGIYQYLQAPPQTPLRLLNTVDLRRYMPNAQTGGICNFSSFSYPNLGSQLHEDPSETLHTARDTMNALKAQMIGTGDLFMLRFCANIIPFSWLYRIFPHILVRLRWMLPPAFTNMGQIDSTRFSFEGLRVRNAWLSASIVYPPFFVGGISGFEQQITISTGYCESGISSADIDRLFDMIVSELPSEHAQ